MDRLGGSLHGQPLTKQKYASLLVDGQIMMTDAEFEQMTNVDFVREARGDVLLAGLGLGFVLGSQVRKRCSSITVIEKSADVIALVGKHYPGVKIVHADILTWKPPADARYDAIYFDVWGDFSADDLKTAAKLERRFRKHLKPEGWIGSWCRFALRASRRRR
jgi:spermidine synthase